MNWGWGVGWAGGGEMPAVSVGMTGAGQGVFTLLSYPRPSPSFLRRQESGRSPVLVRAATACLSRAVAAAECSAADEPRLVGGFLPAQE